MSSERTLLVKMMPSVRGVFLAVVMLVTLLSAGRACPRPCSCYQPSELHCTFRSLLTLPQPLPPHTKHINLGFNSIRSIPDRSLAGLKRLELLMLHGNDIHDIPEGAFQDLSSLQVLKMSYNKLREISADSFSGLSSLLRLYLDHNRLQFLHPRALLRLPNLRLIRLQGNRLHQLHPQAFCALSLLQTFCYSTLRHLDLSNNSLSALHEDILRSTPFLETLALQTNPWDCDCSMAWLQAWSISHPGLLKCPGPQCPVCASPDHLKEQGLLQHEELSCTAPAISTNPRVSSQEGGEVQEIETFREAIGHASLGMSDQQGNAVDLRCNITHSQTPDISPPQHVSPTTPISLPLSVSLDCGVDAPSYQRLWRLLAYYSETPVRLQREIMLGKAPRLGYRYRQTAEREGYYHTGVVANLQAQPTWLLQSHVSLQLNRAQSSAQTVKLYLSTLVTAPPDPPSPMPWVLIQTNRTHTGFHAATGSQMQLPCRVRSSAAHQNSGDPRLQWVLPGGSMVTSPYRSSDDRVQVSGQGLLLKRVDHSDAGLYYCVARMGGDVDVLPLRLEVVESSKPPPGEELGPAVTGLVGVPVSLPCQASGSPKVVVSWILPGGGVIGGRNTGRRRGEGMTTVLANGSLSLPRPGLGDAGLYRCVAVNQFGSDSLSTTLTLTTHVSDTSPRSRFPTRPQSAMRVSNRVSAHLKGDEGEEGGSGDDQEEEENILPIRAGHTRRKGQPPSGPHTVNVERGQPLNKGREHLSRGFPVEQRKNRLEGRRKFNLAKHKIDPQRWADLLTKIREKTAPKITATSYVPTPTAVRTITSAPTELKITTSAPTDTHPEGKQLGSTQPMRIHPDTMQTESTQPMRIHPDTTQTESTQPMRIHPDTTQTESTQSKNTAVVTVGRKSLHHPVLESKTDTTEGSTIDNSSQQEEGLTTVQTLLFPDLLTKDKVDPETPTTSEQRNNIPQTSQPTTDTEMGTDRDSVPKCTKPSSNVNDIRTEEVKPNITPTRSSGEADRTENTNTAQITFSNSVPSRPRSPWNVRRRPGQGRRISKPRVRPIPHQNPPGPTTHAQNIRSPTTSSSVVVEQSELPEAAITNATTTTTAAPSSTGNSTPSRASVHPRPSQTNTDTMTHSANTAAWLPDSTTHTSTHAVTHAHTDKQRCAEREGQAWATQKKQDPSDFKQHNTENNKAPLPRCRTTPAGTDEEQHETEPNVVHPSVTDEEPSEVEPLYPTTSEEPSKVDQLYPPTAEEPSEVEPFYPTTTEEPIEVELVHAGNAEESNEVEALYPAPGEDPIEVEPLYPDAEGLPIEVEPRYPDAEGLPIEVEPRYPDAEGLPIEVEPWYPDAEGLPIEVEPRYPDAEGLPIEVEPVHLAPDEGRERQQASIIVSSVSSTTQLMPQTTADTSNPAVIPSISSTSITITTTTIPKTTTIIPTATIPEITTMVPTTAIHKTTTTIHTTTSTVPIATVTRTSLTTLPATTTASLPPTTISTATTTSTTTALRRDPGLNAIPDSHRRYHPASHPTSPQHPSVRHPYVYRRPDPVRSPSQTPPLIKHAPPLPNTVKPKHLPHIETPSSAVPPTSLSTPDKAPPTDTPTRLHPSIPARFLCLSSDCSVTAQRPLQTPTLRIRPRIAPPHLRTMSVPAGGDTLLTCEAIGQPPPTITWTKVSTGAVMSLDSKAERFQVLPNGTLFIRSLQVQDRGTYICSAKNSVGLDHTMVTLEVWSRPPRIQLPSHREATVHRGGEVRLECWAQGVPPPLLTWVLPDSSILTPDPTSSHIPNPRLSIFPNGTLRIIKAGPPDRGLYRCVASNPAGASSLSVRLHVSSLPPAIQQPREERITRTAGMPLYVHCSALGAPVPSIRWKTPDGTLLLPSQFLNGNLFVFPNATLLIRKLALNDSGNYECLATNAVGGDKRNVSVEVTVSAETATSYINNHSGRLPSSSMLKPPLPPSSSLSKARILSTSPSSSLVMYGDPLLLHCSATGNPEPRVVWRVPGKKLIDAQYSFDKRMKVHSNGTLDIQSVTEKDRGDYLCVARNKMANDFRLLRVTVVIKPAKIEPRQPLQQKVVSYGGALKVDCPVTGQPDPTVRWSLPDGTSVNSVLLQGKEKEGHRRRLVVFDNGTLFFSSVGMEQEGEYVCHAENQAGRDAMSVTVKVLASPPSFHNTEHEVVKVRHGGMVVLSCGATGQPIPAITWFSPNNQVLPGGRSGPVVLRLDGSLVIQGARGADGGNYTCRASNPAGERSRVIAVEVMENPPSFAHSGASVDRHTAISSGISSVTSNGQTVNANNDVSTVNGVSDNGVSNVGDQRVSAVQGQNVFLPCPALGFPPPRLYWLLPGNGVLLAPYYGSRLTVHRNGTLELRALRPSDAGRLVCVARSKGGEVRKSVHLEVSDAQSAPQSRGLVTMKKPLLTEEVSGRRSTSTTLRSHQGTPQSTDPVTAEQHRSRGSISLEKPQSGGPVNTNKPHSGGSISLEKFYSGVSVSVEKPHSGGSVSVEKPRSGGSVSVEKSHSGGSVSVEKLHSGGSVSVEKPHSGGSVSVEKPHSGGSVSIEKPHSGGSVSVEKPHSGGSVSVEKPHSGGSVSVEKPHSGSSVSVEKPRSGGSVSVEKPHSGGSGIEEKLNSGGSVSFEKTLPAVPVQGDTSRPSGPALEAGRSGSLEKKPLVISRSASLISIVNGENLHLPCPQTDSQGSSQPQSLTWTLPSGVVMSQSQAARTGRISVQDDGTLIIQQVSVFDRGTYSCRSINEGTLSILTVPVIVIAYPPRITNGPAPLTYTRPGVAVQLTCNAIATPRATITWEMPDQSQLRVTAQARLYGNLYLSPQGSLVIQNPTSRDTGFYRCTARNVIGSDTKATYVHVI